MAYNDSALIYYIAYFERAQVHVHVYHSVFVLRCMTCEMSQITQRDILNSVDRETSGDFRRGLCAVAQSVKCRPKFFAEALHRSMKGLGTDDSTLIRICVSRSEVRYHYQSRVSFELFPRLIHEIIIFAAQKKLSIYQFVTCITIEVDRNL